MAGKAHRILAILTERLDSPPRAGLQSITVKHGAPRFEITHSAALNHVGIGRVQFVQHLIADLLGLDLLGLQGVVVALLRDMEVQSHVDR